MCPLSQRQCPNNVLKCRSFNSLLLDPTQDKTEMPTPFEDAFRPIAASLRFTAHMQLPQWTQLPGPWPSPAGNAIPFSRAGSNWRKAARPAPPQGRSLDSHPSPVPRGPKVPQQHVQRVCREGGRFPVARNPISQGSIQRSHKMLLDLPPAAPFQLEIHV